MNNTKRRAPEEINSLVIKARELISAGMAKTKAASEVGLNYPTLAKHLKDKKVFKSGDKVDMAYTRFKEALEKQIRSEILEEIRG